MLINAIIRNSFMKNLIVFAIPNFSTIDITSTAPKVCMML